ncbi:MAG: PAS domain S-box protein, partial [Alphaproteobacteria bacterium]|nr:PAS domain S-box protein [Alphaproteobacteria bacterium]
MKIRKPGAIPKPPRRFSAIALVYALLGVVTAIIALLAMAASEQRSIDNAVAREQADFDINVAAAIDDIEDGIFAIGQLKAEAEGAEPHLQTIAHSIALISDFHARHSGSSMDPALAPLTAAHENLRSKTLPAVQSEGVGDTVATFRDSLHQLERAAKADQAEQNGDLLEARRFVTVWFTAASIAVFVIGFAMALLIIRNITRNQDAQKVISEALRRSERRFRNVAEGSIQGVLVHRDGVPLFANQAMAEILGFEDSHDVMLLPSIYESVLGMDREMVKQFAESQAAGTGDDSDRIQFRCRRDDNGETIYVEARSTVIDWDGTPAIQAACFDVTERHRFEEALRESENRLNAFFNHASVAMALYDSRGYCMKMNQALADAAGVVAEAQVNRHVTEILPPELATVMQHNLQQILGTGEPMLDVEIVDGTKDAQGRDRYWMASIFPVSGTRHKPTAFGSVMTEITDQKQEQKRTQQFGESLERRVDERTRQLMREKRRIEKYLQITSTIVVVVDRNFEIQVANPAACALLGYEEGELLGKDWFDQCVPESEREERRQLFLRVWADEGSKADGHSYETSVVTKSGDLRQLLWRTGQLRDDDGALYAYIGCGEDVTSIRQAESRTQKSRRLESFGALTRTTAQAMDRLLENAEVLNQAVLEEVTDDDANQARLESALDTNRKARHALERIFAAGTAGDGNADPQPCDVASLVANSLQLVSIGLPNTVSLTTEIDKAAGSVSADPMDIEAIVMTLFESALQRIGDSEGRVTVALSRQSETESGRDEICLAIEYNGRHPSQAPDETLYQTNLS